MKDNYDLSQLRKKPKRKNSRTKGNSFERQVAQLFNDRFNTTEFSRSPGSGAFATTHTLPEHLKIYGDLITPEGFRFCIECKKGYNNINLYSIYDYKSKLWEFVEQCEKDSKKCDKLPMIVFKQDRKPILIITYKDIFTNIDKYIQIHKEDPYRVYRVYLFDDIIKSWDTMWFEK
jgi:Holliday junction resolvase|tara:strand:- start:9092 stop:9616 length:525 start_codon:yes stop_codon:yes gene_type:complete